MIRGKLLLIAGGAMLACALTLEPHDLRNAYMVLLGLFMVVDGWRAR